MKSKQIVGMAAWAALFAGAAYGQFVPGHVFVSDSAAKFCGDGDTFWWDRIWEIDPETGQVSLFVELRDEACGYVNGLAFSPDGSRLRASLLLKSQIVEFDSDGNMTVLLDSADGVLGPWGANNLLHTTDPQAGDDVLYVVNHASRNIMKFPADGGPGSVFADNADGIGGLGQLAVAAGGAGNGDIYFANIQAGRYVLRITPEGSASLFDDYGNDKPMALTADDVGHIYVGLSSAKIYRYDAGDPASKELVTDMPFGSAHAITMSPDQSRIYVASLFNQLFAVDVADGSVTMLAEITDGGDASDGIAVVPVPPLVIPAVSEWGLVVMTLLSLTGGTIVLRRRRVHSVS